MRKNIRLVSGGLLLVYFSLAHLAFSQEQKKLQTDSTHISHFLGNIFLTQNGIALVPTFSLDKPAVMSSLVYSFNKRFVEVRPGI